MSRHYEEVWKLIESLDEINSRLSDLLDEERDHKARPCLREAMRSLDTAVSLLEKIDPDDHGEDDYPPGTIIIGKII